MLLDIPKEKLKLSFAGECWVDGMFTTENALTSRYGILFESGNDPSGSEIVVQHRSRFE